MNDTGRFQRLSIAARAEEDDAHAQIKVDIRNLDFYYGSQHSLKNVSLQLPDKRITAFMGDLSSKIDRVLQLTEHMERIDEVNARLASMSWRCTYP